MAFFLCSIFVALLNKTEDYSTLMAYFFDIEYQQENILPITRGAGFLIGYNLGIVFYLFKKRQRDKENFWLMARLQRKAFRVGTPLLGIAGFVVIAWLLSTMDGQQI